MDRYGIIENVFELMWNWTIKYSKEAQALLEQTGTANRAEIEQALANQYWPQKSLKKVMGRIGTSFWPLNTVHFRILCMLDEQYKIVKIVEIRPLSE